MKSANWFLWIVLILGTSFFVEVTCLADDDQNTTEVSATPSSEQPSDTSEDVLGESNGGFFDEISATLSFSVWSQYLANSGGMIFHNKPVIQSDLTISFDNPGIYLDLWNSTGLNGGGFSSDYGDEFDITIGWVYIFEDSGISVDVGVSRFDILPVGKISDDDITQPFITISREWQIAENHTIAPYARFEVLWADGGNPNGETYIHFGTTYDIGLTEDLSLSQKFDICYDPGMFGFDSGFIGGYEVGLGLDLDSMHIDLFQIRVATPLESLDDDRGTEVVFGAGVSFRF